MKRVHNMTSIALLKEALCFRVHNPPDPRDLQNNSKTKNTCPCSLQDLEDIRRKKKVSYYYILSTHVPKGFTKIDSRDHISISRFAAVVRAWFMLISVSTTSFFS